MVFLSPASAAAAISLTGMGGWPTYGGNPQHSATYQGFTQSAQSIHWSTPLDDNRSYYGGDVLIHYASPLVSPRNTVVHGFRYTTTPGGSPHYDNWRVVGRSGVNGRQLWTMNTDYSAPIVWPQDWTSVFPMTLVPITSMATISYGPFTISFPIRNEGVAVAGSGGTIVTRTTADGAGGGGARLAFYTSTSNYYDNSSGYSVVKINTPITADSSGNLYFGYVVTGSLFQGAANLGTGGIAKVNASTGAATYRTVSSLNVDSSLSRPAMNAAPAVSPDGASVYVALTNGGGNNGFLAKLRTSDLSPTASVKLMDPSVPGGGAQLINESSGSPMVGPDGHVFMGSFGYYWRESHGWMLQFDANLSPNDSTGKALPVGAFGWDDTASVVPASMVPSYKGSSSYLLLTKYNNYDMGGDPGADGLNKIAILDPASNTTTTDRQSGIPVMNEILTVVGPTHLPSQEHPDARNEWCINSAAIDVNRKSAIINSEDGHMYRWDLTTNTLTEGLSLAPPTGEAYTSTLIGPDGQIYAINNSVLFALGSAKAQGTGGTISGTGTGARPLLPLTRNSAGKAQH